MKIETPIETPYDRESINKERDRIKAANRQIIINILEAQGVDETKIPIHEFDMLLRIMKEDSVLQGKHNKLMARFSEIIAPYKTVTVSPDISDEITHAPLEPEPGKEEIPELDKVKDGKIMCKCGHWIGIVGTKWQHMAVILTDSCGGGTPTTSEIKYRESCHYCDCAEPTLALEH